MDWTNLVRAVFRSSSPIPDDEVVEELAQHVRATYEAARANGCSDEEANRLVTDLLDRWRVDASALQHRQRRPPTVTPPPTASSSHFAGLLHDIRYATRLLRRQPRHASLTIATLALGIGATTVLFSVTYGVLMKPLPWPRSDSIVVLKETRGGSMPRFGALTNAACLAWREKATTIEDIAAWSQSLVTITGAGDPDRIRIVAATPSLFPVLGARPLIGSFFSNDDDTSPVVVLSERLWRERFGSDLSVLAKAVSLDGKLHTVVGVLPDRQAYPDRQTYAIVPLSVRPTSADYLSMFNAIAALRPGVTPVQAAAEATARGHFAANTGMSTTEIFGNNGPIEITALPLRDALTDDVRRPLMLLLLAVGLLLVTATANVASLHLARTTTRYREMAIRAALGAGGARVTRQLLVESLLLGLTGGALGLALTQLLHRSARALLPADFPRLDDVAVDAAVWAFALVVSVGTSIVFGLLPALRVRRLNLVEALAEDGTAPAGAVVRSRTRTRSLIMAGQVAIACVLLVGASLLGRSFVALLNADRGYDLTDVLSARLSMSAAMYSAPERRFEIIDRVLGRLTAIPGVTEAAFTSELPLTPGGSTSAFDVKSSNGEIVKAQASPRIVSPRYFAALRTTAIAGRIFSDLDTASSERVVVVNQMFARRYLGVSPLDAKVLRQGLGATVVGLVFGLLASALLTSLLSSQLYGVTPHDTLTFTVVPLLLLFVGALACAIPALRAANLDPVRVLRGG